MERQLAVIQEPNFSCDPHMLCEGAYCCRGIETNPSLSLGDYIRIGEATGKKLSKLWRETGDVSLMGFKDMKKGDYCVTLSLLHDPCPYLGSDFRCDIYETRPLGCGDFPFTLFRDHPNQIRENYRNYRCLHHVRLGPEQARIGEELDQIIIKEAELDVHILWLNQLQLVSVPHPAAYSELAAVALGLQSRRDPNVRTHRSRRLLGAINKMASLVKDGTIARGIETDLYVSMIQPVVFVLLEDEIAERLDSLTEAEIAAYGETTRLWKNLARQNAGSSL